MEGEFQLDGEGAAAVRLERNSTESGSGGSNSIYAKRDALYIVVPITIIYGAILITGTVGNIVTCIVIARNKSMHNATNFYLFSLAISDLLLLVSGLPQEMYMVWSKYPYIFGEAFCMIRGLAAETSTNASVLTITAFTVERYVAICHPFFARTLSKLSRAVKLILCIWAVSLIFAVPQALQFGIVVDSSHKTDSTDPNEMVTACQVKEILFEHSFEFSTFVFFIFPMTLISVLYALIGLRLRRSASLHRGAPNSNSVHTPVGAGNATDVAAGTDLRRQGGSTKQQSSQRVLKMLVAVVVAFFICWAPFHAQRLFATYGFTGESSSRYVHVAYAILTYVSGIFYYVSTTINPILYHIMSNKFREAFKGTLSCCCSIQRRRRQRGPYSQLSLRKEQLGQMTVEHTSVTDPYPTQDRPPEIQFEVPVPEIHAESNGYQLNSAKTNFVFINSSRPQSGSRDDQWSSSYPSSLTKKSMAASTTSTKPNFLVVRDIRPQKSRHTMILSPFKYPCCRNCTKSESVETQTRGMRIVYQKSRLEVSTRRKVGDEIYTSNDVSNSSLKDIERGALEDELEAYMSEFNKQGAQKEMLKMAPV